jgi:hypothetical protein
LSKPKTIMVNLKHTFTPAEKREIAASLAQANERKVALEEQKKEVDADLKGQITATETRIATDARKYNNGYEYRDVECYPVYHSPEQGMKSVYRKDTGEFVRDMRMDTTEMQENLFEEQEAEQ